MGFAYLITDKINKLVYVGQTLDSLQNRLRSHILASKRPKSPIQWAIHDHGPDAFMIESLVESDNLDILDQSEILYIKLYDSTNPEKGYNRQTGGRVGHKNLGGKRQPLTKEHREKLHEAHLGKKHTLEHRKHTSEAHLGEGNGKFRTRWLHKEDKEKQVPRDLIDSYLQDGWLFGRPSAIKQAKEARKSVVWTPKLKKSMSQRCKENPRPRGKNGRFQCS